MLLYPVVRIREDVLLPSKSNIVCSGVTGAKAGTLSFLVGGTEKVFQVSQPILSHMGERIIYCGPSGSGLAAKICNNVSDRSTLKLALKKLKKINSWFWVFSRS
jgi:hypothetical protein